MDVKKINNLKFCNKCKTEKALADFHKNKRSNDGFHFWCKSCVSEYGKQSRINNPYSYNKSKERHRDYMKVYGPILWQRDKGDKEKILLRTKRWERYRASIRGKFACWKKNATKRGLEWNLTLRDIEALPMTCYYTGLELTVEPFFSNTVSLDRLDSNLGYYPENVVLCCKVINVMKSTLPVSRFIELCKMIYLHSEMNISLKNVNGN